MQYQRFGAPASLVWTLGGFAVLLSYAVIAGIWLYIETLLPVFYQTLLPEFRSSVDEVAFKREFVAYILFQIFFALVLSLWWIAISYFNRINSIIISRYIPGVMLILILVLSIFITQGVLKFAVKLSACCFFVSTILSFIPNKAADAASRFWCSEGHYTTFRYSYIFMALLIVSSAALAIYIILPGAHAWYPVILPNDYYEAGDFFIIQDGRNTFKVSRDALAACLGYGDYRLNCPIDSSVAENYKSAFDKTFQWQTNYNRLLYHHSYMFVPARHWLEHGFDRTVLYLYGYGTTISHGLAMVITGGGLGGYFNSYPVLLLVGVIAISLCVTYVCRSVLLCALAFVIALTRLYYIDFEDAFIAASFSPLRYIGLCVQIASVFYALRGRHGRLIALPAAAVFSLFWNFEFAAFGMVAQGLAILSPTIVISYIQRAGMMAVMLTLPAVYLMLSRVDASIIQVTSTQFFQIGMPEENLDVMMQTFKMAATMQALALALCFTFKGPERYARLAVLPAIMLLVVKYIFNPAGQHMNITLVFLYPFMLVYLPTALYKPGRLPTWALSVIGIVSITYWTWEARDVGNYYLRRSHEVHESLTRHMETKTWSGVKDGIRMALPDAAISSRVSALQKQLRSGDTLLIFSPFDHLMAYYVPPTKFCGQFELLSSFVLTRHIDQVHSCLTAQNLLVVYDTKLGEPCPDWPVSNACEMKLRMKRRVEAVFQGMLPHLREVGRSGDLVFYRQIKQADQ